MSYYDNPQWSGPGPASAQSTGGNWEHQAAATTPVRAGASGPQPQDDFAFSYQFDEVDRAYENLQKSGKGFMMGGRRKSSFSPYPSQHSDGRAPHGNARAHSVNYDGPQGSPGPNIHNFYAQQRHQSSRGSNEAEQVMQAKRRMAAQRERELRNLHTEQQYQRTVLSEMPMTANNNTTSASPHPHANVNAPPHPNSGNNGNNGSNNSNKHMSEEETRELIARQRSALYGEGPFADKTSYVDESGNVRQGAPGHSGTSSLRGNSPLAYEGLVRGPPVDAGTPGPSSDPTAAPVDANSRAQSTASPQTSGPTNKVFDNAVGQSRTNTSSPTGGSPPRDLAPGSKQGAGGATVAPIGTRPSGTPSNASSAKRSTTPLTSSGGWGRGNGVWGQSSGLGAQASVWG